MRLPPDALELIDLVYGALYGESSWSDFLERTRLLLPNGQALLFYHDQNSGRGASSLGAGFDEGMLASYAAYYSSVNPWMPHASTRPLQRVVQADEMLPRHELKATEFYNEFLAPQDIETGLGVTLRRDAGYNFLFSIICADIDESHAASVQQTLQAVVPHLRRAFGHYQKLAIEPFLLPEVAAKDFDLKARGIVRVSHNMMVTFADEAAVSLAERSGCLSVGPFGRFQCTHRPVIDFVTAALEAWNGAAASPVGHVFHLRQKDQSLPLRVSVFRPGGMGNTFFTGPECIVHIEDLAEGLAPAVEDFSTMYGLTAAERRILFGLVRGLTVDQIASESRTSPATVRTQLKHLFLKTGFNRQSDLVRHICLTAGAPRYT